MSNSLIRHITIAFIISTLMGLMACSQDSTDPPSTQTPTSEATNKESLTQVSGDTDTFKYLAERFADIQILRYKVPGFEDLSLQQKTLLYYLSEAALSGRDIMWDQNNAYNLRIRAVVEEIVKHYQGDRSTEAFKAFMTYAQQIWLANGIHHHYSSAKFNPAFSFEDLLGWAQSIKAEATWPTQKDQSLEDLLAELKPIIFDPSVAAKKVNRDQGVDKVLDSAVNFYENVTEAEVVAFYQEASKNDKERPISHGLNSKLVKEQGELKEKTWYIDGMYGEAIEKVVYWLEKAITVAENPKQKKALELLVKYYRSGDLADFDQYNIAWVADSESAIDVINGFIEVYNDPLGYRGSFESVVSFRDEEATQRIGKIADYAQWFEDHSPILDTHKKEEVKGILGKAITVVAESGDASPTTPIGINLPNADWIRAQYGSKSVSLSNITDAYNATRGALLEEFAFSEQEIDLAKKYGELSSHLHTDMHEVIGHASGKLDPGVKTTKETLKQYASTMEEARADLVALYFLRDPKLVEIGVMPNLDVGRVEYDRYIRNGLMQQLSRLKPGEQLEEAHMQNRQLIALWAYEKGKTDKVIEYVKKENKTYLKINDYEKLRLLFGELLREMQRIKSEGDYAAAEHLVETYGVKVDQEIHQEVLERFAKLDVAPYQGFINPKLVAIFEDETITDVQVEYPESFIDQMLYYGEHYNYLPPIN